MYRAKVNAYRSITECADGQCEGEPDVLIGLMSDPAHRLRGVHISGIQDACLVEHCEQTVGALHFSER
jgi:hypothetical protein